MQEFLDEPSPEEGADVATALINWFAANGWDLAEYIRRKNDINVGRTWVQLPSGHFQHVEPT